MSLAQIKDEAAGLQPTEQRELIAFLIAQQTASDRSLQHELARKIDDADPAHWVELDKLLERYS